MSTDQKTPTTVRIGKGEPIQIDFERGLTITDDLGNEWLIRQAPLPANITEGRLEIMLVPSAKGDISVRPQTANKVHLEAVGW